MGEREGEMRGERRGREEVREIVRVLHVKLLSSYTGICELHMNVKYENIDDMLYLIY